MSSRNAIEIRNLSFAFADSRILQEINLTFEPGKFYAILGPNGSGKTTLLRIISGSLAPAAGSVMVNGAAVRSLSSQSLARQLAVVPQDSTGEFDFSVWDVVLMGRTPYLARFAVEGADDLAIARQALEMTDTWHLRERSLRQLSGGERQRVMVARAVTQATGIILLDEPVSHLDLYQQIALLKQVRELNRTRQLTVLAVLHDLNLAAAFSDRLVLMQQGRVYCHGAPEQVLQPEVIREVYGVEVELVPLPESGRVYVVPKI